MERLHAAASSRPKPRPGKPSSSRRASRAVTEHLRIFIVRKRFDGSGNRGNRQREEGGPGGCEMELADRKTYGSRKRFEQGRAEEAAGDVAGLGLEADGDGALSRQHRSGKRVFDVEEFARLVE